MFGPHFYYDLIRLARKPRNIALRCGYLLALLVGWWFIYEESSPVHGSINEYAGLATRYTHALLIFQYLLIPLLTPIYLSGTILEEKQAGRPTTNNTKSSLSTMLRQTVLLRTRVNRVPR